MCSCSSSPTLVKWAPAWLASTRGLDANQRAEELGRVRTALLASIVGGIAVYGTPDARDVRWGASGGRGPLACRQAPGEDSIRVPTRYPPIATSLLGIGEKQVISSDFPVPPEGIEPSTFGLKVRCSAN
jgi:hypothetical protein